ncbi:MAG TPA: cytochrome c biogenesis protein CcdA [Candidatus Dojkabacteria bacterium]|nr:cytochrome c biogenesis protein CcdA [Candidatus Dojkabacteria bacterium]
MDELSLITAFGAGLITFFAPCTFVTLPIFLSYLSLSISGKNLNVQAKTGNSLQDTAQITVWQTFAGAILYVGGFLIVFTLLGVTASEFGRSLFQNKEVFTKIGALLVIFFGIFILFGEKVAKLQFLYQEKKFRIDSRRFKNSLFLPVIIGITSAFAWTPCIGPILGGILFLAASTQTALQGGILLFLYGLGINLPFLLLAIIAARSAGFVQKFSSIAAKLQKMAAVIMIILGIILFTGWYSEIFGQVYQIFIKLGYRPN